MSFGCTVPTLEAQRARYCLFFAIYFYQGLVAGFSLTALANHLAARGLPAGEFGLHFALAGLPWTFQPLLWGPFVDKAGQAAMGRRRLWAIAAAVSAQGCLLILLFTPSTQALGLIDGAFFLHGVCASLLDTASDRLILDHVPAHEQGRMSACTRGGFVLGTSLSAALFGWLLELLTFSANVLVLMLVSTVVLLPLLVVRECQGDAFLSLQRTAPAARAPLVRFYPRLAAGLGGREALRLLALCFFVDALLGAFEVRLGGDLLRGLGWDATRLSWVQAILALATGTVGALGIGLWVDRAGAGTPLAVLLLGSAAAYAVSAVLLGAGLAAANGAAVLVITGALPNLIVVALVPVLLTASRGRQGAATQFELFMATMNLGSVAGSFVSAQFADTVSLAWVAAFVSCGLAACTILSANRSPA